MKVLMLNTFDDVAGADRAACRLQDGLKSLGVDSSLLVQFQFNPESDVVCTGGSVLKMLRRLKLYLGMLPVRLYPNRPENNFTPALFPDRLAAAAADFGPDLVHLHWLGAGFCGIESIGRFDRPLVWTLHDSWPFTGGCHVPGSCTRYRDRCGSCPVLGSNRDNDLSRWTWQRKHRGWRGREITLVAPSRWLAECARSSSLFKGCRIEVIPNGLDTERFRPVDKAAARELLGLHRDRPLILFGAVNPAGDPNKGWHLLRPALESVRRHLPEAEVAVFGDDGAGWDGALANVTFLGRIKDDARLAAVYSAADVLVVPSLQEAFCQTATEAMACATPVVAFAATGLLDVVEHQETGYLAFPYDSNDLARGILWVLGDRARHKALCAGARARAEGKFAIGKIAEAHLSLYQELISQRGHTARNP